MQPKLSALALPTDSVYDATNELATSLRQHSDAYAEWKKIEDLLAETDQLLGALEQLNMHAQKMIPKDDVHWRIYTRVRELCELLDTDFRTKLFKQTQHCLDAVFELQAKILPRVVWARAELRQWETLERLLMEDDVGEDT